MKQLALLLLLLLSTAPVVGKECDPLKDEVTIRLSDEVEVVNGTARVDVGLENCVNFQAKSGQASSSLVFYVEFDTNVIKFVKSISARQSRNRRKLVDRTGRAFDDNFLCMPADPDHPFDYDCHNRDAPYDGDAKRISCSWWSLQFGCPPTGSGTNAHLGSIEFSVVGDECDSTAVDMTGLVPILNLWGNATCGKDGSVEIFGKECRQGNEVSP